MSEFRYIPALDGLRALAVLAVLAFHAQLSFAQGGFLGVSVFFTLSGYLITSLLINEHASTGTISLRSFYGKRLRRLIPGSYACVALVIALGVLWSTYQREHLAGDVTAALANVSNWRFALASRSYSDLFLASPSPLAHFWSLAIEEQCYVVIPVVVVVSLRRGRRTLLIVTIGLLAASFAAMLATSDFDIAYNGTHTRAAELLAGVLLAQVTIRRVSPSRALGAAGAAALVALTALVATTAVTDRWLYRGGLLAVAALSVTVIATLARGGGLARVLAWSPLVAIGKVSYGLYLVHWPVFLVLSPERMHMHGVALAGVRTTVSIAIATLSYLQLEIPIRRRHLLVSPRVALGAMGIALPALLVAALLAVPAARYTPTQQLLAKGASGLVDFGDPPASQPAPNTKVAVIHPAPSRVLVLGSDNSPVGLLSLMGYDVLDGVQPGCPIANAAEARLSDGTIISTSACESIRDRWPRLVAQDHPNLVIVSTGSLDRALSRRESDVGFPNSAQLGELDELVRRTDAAYADLDWVVGQIEATGVPLVVADHPDPVTGGADLEHAYLERLRMSHPGIGGFTSMDQDLITTVNNVLGAPRGIDERLNVLVIGDSTSFNLAQALSDAAPDRLHVIWAGENGCPFVRVEQIRARSSDPWTPSRCTPFDLKVTPLLDSLHPQVVLLVASLFELTEQQYPGDPTGHAPGDPQYIAFHDSEMAAFVSILQAHAVPLLVADSPRIRAGMATPEQADPRRTVAWNAQIHRWDDSSPYISTFSYAGPIQTAEAAQGSIRHDGVHPEIAPLTDLARTVLVDQLIAQTTDMRATLGL